MHIKFISFILLLHVIPKLYSQNDTTPLDDYQNNITKAKLYGVYIPQDIEDAVKRLDKLIEEDQKSKIKSIDELAFAKKLRFGLGRWMEYNWNLQEGSRLSHHLRQKNINHPDDMVELLMRVYHRHTTNQPWQLEQLMAEILDKRQKKQEKDQQNLPVLDSIVKPSIPPQGG